MPYSNCVVPFAYGAQESGTARERSRGANRVTWAAPEIFFVQVKLL
jgi:hypothetical protein